MEKIGVGLIGCGRIASQHFESLRILHDVFSLRKVSDTDEASARRVAQDQSVAYTTRYQELLEERDIDLVVVATPNRYHKDQVIEALEAKKHVLVEKPSGMSLREVDEIIQISQKTGMRAFCVAQVRYNPAVRVLRDVIRQGELGEIHTVSLNVLLARPKAYFENAGWRAKKEMAGGSLLNQGIHYLDLLTWLFGDVKSVFAKVANLSHPYIDIEDTVFATLVFSRGALGSIVFTISAYPENLECSLTALGTHGSIKLGGRAVDEIEFWRVEDVPMPEITQAEDKGHGRLGGMSPNHVFVYQDLGKFFLDGTLPDFEVAAMRPTQELIEAIYRSGEEQREITLPLEVSL